MSRTLLVVTTAFLLLSLHGDVHAQHWQEVKLPPGVKSLSPYFVTANYGFVYTSGVMSWSGPFSKALSQTDPVALYRTLDGGRNWIPMNLAEIPNMSFAMLTQLRFISASHGFLSAVVIDSEVDYRGGLYETVDSGLNWRRISPNGFAFNSVALTDSFAYLSKFGKFDEVPESIAILNLRTHTITEVAAAGPSIVSNGLRTVYSHHCDHTDQTGVTMRTTDDGVTWNSFEHGASTIESWSSYAIRGKSIFLRDAEVPEISLNPVKSEIQRSSDGGINWKVVHTSLGNAAIGDIDGDGCAIYVSQSTAAFPDSGLIRSTDGGLTWVQVGGPIHRADSRSLSVVENGVVVYATADGDLFAHPHIPVSTHLWRSMDGGNGDLPGSLLEALHSPGPISSTLCDFSVTKISLSFNALCLGGVQVSKIDLLGDSIHFQLDSLPHLPKFFGGDSSDRVVLRFAPGGSLGDFSTNLHVHGSILLKDTSYEYDTVLQIQATSKSSLPRLSALASNFDFGNISTCIGRADTQVVFVNHGCTPDTILSIHIDGTGFSGQSLTFPIIVPPDSSVAISILFNPVDQATYSGTVDVRVSTMGSTRGILIGLDGKGSQGTGILSVAKDRLDLGSQSVCSADSTATTSFTNVGCDTLVISGVQFQSDGSFTADAKNDSLLYPGSTFTYAFHFIPQSKGAHSARLLIHSRNLHGTDPGFDTVIALQGIGKSGTSHLTASIGSIDLGTLYGCESKDTSIWLKNPGCDTLIVRSGSLTGASFLSSVSYPFMILPGDSNRVSIHFDTTGSNGATNLTGSYDAVSDSGTVHIPLIASVRRPASLVLTIGDAQSAANGGLVTFLLELQGYLPSPIDAMSFDLTHDDDLLSFSKISGNGLSISKTDEPSNAQVQHFRLAPVSQLGEIGTLSYKAFLSKFPTTLLTLSNIRFDTKSTLPLDCIASVSDSNTSFSYIYSCAEHTIQEYMQSGSFAIERISPNPASSSLLVELSGVPNEAVVGLYDLLGNEVIEHTSTARKANFDLAHIAEGTYFIRAVSNSTVRSARVVVKR